MTGVEESQAIGKGETAAETEPGFQEAEVQLEPESHHVQRVHSCQVMAPSLGVCAALLLFDPPLSFFRSRSHSHGFLRFLVVGVYDLAYLNIVGYV